MTGQQIVVAADGSAASIEAQDRAAALAGGEGVVHLVCGYRDADDWRMRRERVGAPADVVHLLEARAQAEALLDDARDRLTGAGVVVELHARRQEPAQALGSVAREREADVIVVCGRFSARRAAFDAPCPVQDARAELRARRRSSRRRIASSLWPVGAPRLRPGT